MIDESSILKGVAGYSLVRGIDRVPKGHLRIETGLLYPDGSAIDVFVLEDLDSPSGLRLSDLAQTTAWLLSMQVRPWLSKGRQALLQDAISIYGVEQRGGALERAVLGMDSISEDIVRVAQACLRVSDLSFTKRAATRSSFVEKVEEYLEDVELEYEPNTELPGRFGTSVRVDYLVRGHRVTSALLALSAPTPSQGHIFANEILRKWYDLSYDSRDEQRVTLLDDEKPPRDDDVKRLETLSVVVPFSDREGVRQLLAT